MPKPKPPLSIVGASASSPFPEPPGALGEAGLSLWNRVQREYGISDSGGAELLYQICGAADRLGQLQAAIDADGPVIQTRNGPKSHPALRDEIACRAFIARGLTRLGLSLEPVRAPGRPSTGSGISWKQI